MYNLHALIEFSLELSNLSYAKLYFLKDNSTPVPLLLPSNAVNLNINRTPMTTPEGGHALKLWIYTDKNQCLSVFSVPARL